MKSKPTLDYPNTCPIIDRSISCVNDDVKEALERYTERLFPLLDTLPPELIIMAQECAEDLIQDIERQFGVVRKSNESIRAAADDQIGTMWEDMVDMDQQLDDLING